MENTKGLYYAFLSSFTFGFAPAFSVALLESGYSPQEVLSYRWGIATLGLVVFGLCCHYNFRLNSRQLLTVAGLSIFRSATSLSLIYAYSYISTGTASTIHFMYPLAVAVGMSCFFKEKWSWRIFGAIVVSICGTVLLCLGNERTMGTEHPLIGIAAACMSVFAYAAYNIGVNKSCASRINSTVLTCYVMGLGSLYFIAWGWLGGGIRLESEPANWLYILGLALPATAVSNITLVMAIKKIGSTLTAVFGAMEPLTAVLIGVLFLHEELHLAGIAGIVLILSAVMVATRQKTGSETKPHNSNP